MSSYLNRFQVLPLAIVASLAGGLGGCTYEEGLIINNMRGTVVVPRAAATRVLARADGSLDEVVDVRNIGPVYIGVFPGVEDANVLANYPHPEIGPVFKPGVQGDTYPYGGTTVGDLRFACFDALTCKITSGRWESYDAIVDWFNDTLLLPVSDADNRVVEDGEYFRQTCFDLMEVTSDEEVLLLPPDRDDDGEITAKDLDFVENADGDFEAEFTLWQQDFFWNQDQENCEPGVDCDAFSVWAYMDAPSSGDASFVTCSDDAGLGFEVEEYNHDFFGGRVFEDVLNQPDKFISQGDWVASGYLDGGSLVEGAYMWKNVYDRPTIVLGYEVTQ